MEKDPRTHEIIGAAIEVHNIIGQGKLEAVYQECLRIEFKRRNITFVAQPQLKIYYKEIELEKYYIPDLLYLGKLSLRSKLQKL